MIWGEVSGVSTSPCSGNEAYHGGLKMDGHSNLDRECRGISAFFGEPAADWDGILKAHEYERERLGQELHDSAGQLMVALHLSFARLRHDDENPLHAEIIDEIQGTIHEIDRQIRSLAFLHHPAELGTRNVDVAIQALATGFGSRSGIRTSFTSRGNFADLDEAVAVALLRVAQEALVNIHRHAHATTAIIALRSGDGIIELSISDDGVGIPTAPRSDGQGIGLQGMRHRVRSVNGQFEAARLRRGTMIFVRIPIGMRAIADEPMERSRGTGGRVAAG